MEKRPRGVWVISLFMFISAAYTLLSFYLIFSGVISLDQTGQAYFDSLGTIDWLGSVSIGVLNLAAAISLFMLRKISVNLFITAFVLNMLMTVMQAVRTSFTEVLGGSGIIGVLVGLAIMLAIIAYTRRLAKQGTLH